MKKGLFLTAMILSLLSSGSVFATTEKPAACPSVESMVTAGLFTVGMTSNGWVAANLNDPLDTQDYWTFAVVGAHGDNEEQAMISAREILPTLKLVEGPVPGTSPSGTWNCHYISTNQNEDAVGVAITPALAFAFDAISKNIK